MVNYAHEDSLRLQMDESNTGGCMIALLLRGTDKTYKLTLVTKFSNIFIPNLQCK